MPLKSTLVAVVMELLEITNASERFLSRERDLYVLLHEGEGQIAGVMGAKVITREPGRVVLHMSHAPDLVQGIAIARSQSGNHIRNIRVLPLGDEKADLARNPFLTEFVDFCRPFHALRFMDWASTNA